MDQGDQIARKLGICQEKPRFCLFINFFPKKTKFLKKRGLIFQIDLQKWLVPSDINCSKKFPAAPIIVRIFYGRRQDFGIFARIFMYGRRRDFAIFCQDSIWPTPQDFEDGHPENYALYKSNPAAVSSGADNHWSFGAAAYNSS